MDKLNEYIDDRYYRYHDETQRNEFPYRHKEQVTATRLHTNNLCNMYQQRNRLQGIVAKLTAHNLFFVQNLLAYKIATVSIESQVVYMLQNANRNSVLKMMKCYTNLQ